MQANAIFCFVNMLSRIQHREIDVMYILFSLLRIKGLYMFQALLAHLQEALHKQHLVYRVSTLEVYKNICLYIFVPIRFINFIFSALYRVTQKVFLCMSVHFNVGPCCDSTDI
jgi:hypothetical protein